MTGSATPQYMKTWIVTFEGRVRETYLVDAETEAEAREKWSDYEPDISEVLDGAVVSVEGAGL